MAYPEEPPLTTDTAVTMPSVAVRDHPYRDALVALAAAFVVTVVGYLAAVTPGAWFPRADSKEWSPRALALVRGAGGIERDALIVTSSGGGVLITVETDFRSSDYAAIAWIATNLPRDADARLIWRNDYAPAKVNSAPIAIAAGQLRPVIVANDPNWVGRIRGLALAINGALPAPVRILGVSAQPSGILDVANDRIREWTAFEGLSGASINGITGGASVQDLPLPVLLAAVIGLAALAWFGVARYRARTRALPSVLAMLFVAAWLISDVRWSWDLLRQTLATARTYAGLDWRERHLAAEDAALFQFIESVRAKLPPEPSRVFMTADAHYFRGRGAYHLYPHNVYFEPYRNAIPESARMHSGDYFVAYQRRGVQYDPAAQRLRWDGGEPVSAELLLTAPGAALFRIR